MPFILLPGARPVCCSTAAYSVLAVSSVFAGPPSRDTATAIGRRFRAITAHPTRRSLLQASRYQQRSRMGHRLIMLIRFSMRVSHRRPRTNQPCSSYARRAGERSPHYWSTTSLTPLASGSVLPGATRPSRCRRAAAVVGHHDCYGGQAVARRGRPQTEEALRTGCRCHPPRRPATPPARTPRAHGYRRGRKAAPRFARLVAPPHPCGPDGASAWSPMRLGSSCQSFGSRT